MRFRIGDKVTFSRGYQKVYPHTSGEVYTILDIQVDDEGDTAIKCCDGKWTLPIFLVLHTVDTIFEKT